MKLIDVAVWTFTAGLTLYLLWDRPWTACAVLALAFVYGCWSYVDGYAQGYLQGAENLVEECERLQKDQP